jgi:hypothetical protein
LTKPIRETPRCGAGRKRFAAYFEPAIARFDQDLVASGQGQHQMWSRTNLDGARVSDSGVLCSRLVRSR